MARKKSMFQKALVKAEARDRKARSRQRMRVSGKSVFTLARLSGQTKKKPR